MKFSIIRHLAIVFSFILLAGNHTSEGQCVTTSGQLTGQFTPAADVIAQSFQVPCSGVLENVDFFTIPDAVDDGIIDNAVLTIHEDAGYPLGAPLGSIVVSITGGTPESFDFTSQNISLLSLTDYTLVIDTSADPDNLMVDNSDIHGYVDGSIWYDGAELPTNDASFTIDVGACEQPNINVVNILPNTFCAGGNGQIDLQFDTPGGEPAGGYTLNVFEGIDDAGLQVVNNEPVPDGTAGTFVAGLQPGDYFVRTTNNDTGCESVLVVSVFDESFPPGLGYRAFDFINESAISAGDGQIIVTNGATDGSGDYVYEWYTIGDVPLGTTTTLTNLTAGEYYVIAVDNITGCASDPTYVTLHVEEIPIDAPGIPSQDPGDVISIYSDQYTDVSGTDFFPDWAQNTVVTSPNIAGNDVLKYEGFDFQGIQLAATIDVTLFDFLHVDVWTTTTDFLTVSPVNPNSTPIENLVELPSANVGSWVSYDIPLTDFTNAGVALDEVLQMKFEGNFVANQTLFIDNIYFWKTPVVDVTESRLSDLQVDGVTVAGFSPNVFNYNVELAPGTSVVPVVTFTTAGVNPTTMVTDAAAIPGTTTVEVTSEDVSSISTYNLNFTSLSASPTPGQDPADVSAVFSDAYSEIPGTDFNPDWGQNTLMTLTSVDGNQVLEYDNFDYQGIQLAGEEDLTGFEFLHVDVWTNDPVTLDFSPININTVPQQFLVELTPLITGDWSSFDIPLTTFSDQGVTMDQVFQFIFDGQRGALGKRVYVDNIYFWKTPAASDNFTNSAGSYTGTSGTYTGSFNGSDGSSATYITNLESAIKNAIEVNGETILDLSGLSISNGPLVLQLGLNPLVNSLQFTGPGTDQLTLLGASPVFEVLVDDTDLLVENTTVSGGFNSTGGGINFDPSGDVSGSDGILTVDNVIFESNSAAAGFGGAIYYNSSAFSVIINSTFDGNTADYGAAIHMDGGTIDMSNNVFINNTAAVAGGAIAVVNGNSTSSDSYFENNQSLGIGASDGGGAVYLSNSGLTTHQNSTFFNNNSDRNGGAFLADGSTLELIHVTISGNGAGDSGGAVRSQNSSTVVFSSSILWDNLPQDYSRNNSPTNIYLDKNIIGTDSGGGDAVPVDANTDPLFIDLGGSLVSTPEYVVGSQKAFIPNADFAINNGGVGTVAFDQVGQDRGTGSLTLGALEINQDPVVSVPGVGPSTDDATPINLGLGLSAAADSDDDIVDVRLECGITVWSPGIEGKILLGSLPGGVAVTAGVVDTEDVTISGSLNDINTVLNQVQFDPNGIPGTHQIAVIVSDQSSVLNQFGGDNQEIGVFNLEVSGTFALGGDVSGTGAGSLFQAVLAANSTVGLDVIDLSGISTPASFAPALPSITESLQIIGPGSGLLTLVGSSPVFDVTTDDTNLTLSDMTISGGTNTNGGGINFNQSPASTGLLDVANIRFEDNDASGLGGHIYYSSGVTSKINECLFYNSSGGTNGEGVYIAEGGMTINNATFHDISNAPAIAIDGAGGAAQVALNHVTVTGNADGVIATTNAQVFISYSILSGNAGNDLNATVASDINALSNISVIESTPLVIASMQNSAAVITTPQTFDPITTNGDHTDGLLPTDPSAINAATGSGAAIDQTGATRTGTPTLGALEANADPVVNIPGGPLVTDESTPVSFSGISATVTDGDDDNLTVTIAVSYNGEFTTATGTIDVTVAGSATIDSGDNTATVVISGSAADLTTMVNTAVFDPNGVPGYHFIGVTADDGIGTPGGSFVEAAVSGTYEPSTTADGTGPAPLESFRAALNDIEFLNTTFGPAANTIDFGPAATTGTINLVADLPALTGDLTVLGTGADQLTIDGGDTYRIFEVTTDPTDLYLSDVTLANGLNANGGAIEFQSSGNLDLFNIHFFSNSASTAGGAIRTTLASIIAIDGCLFESNSVLGGGNYGGALSITGSAATSRISNSTFFGNASITGGGAIYLSAATIDMDHLTITSNDSPGANGTGLWVDPGTNATINHSINFGNLGIGFDFIVDASGTLDAEGTVNVLGSGAGTVANVGTNPGDPGLGTLADNGGSTSTILIGANAINAATGSTEPFDQVGNARPGVPNNDLGAFEVGAPTILTAEWQDANSNGNIDQVVITFDRNVTITDANGAADGFDGFLISAGNTIDNADYSVFSGTDNMTITFLGDEIGGTGITGLTATYSDASVDALVDFAGIEIANGAQGANVDGAAPVLLTGASTPNDGNTAVTATPGNLTLQFSETITLDIGDVTIYYVNGDSKETIGSGSMTDLGSSLQVPYGDLDDIPGFSIEFYVEISDGLVNDGVNTYVFANDPDVLNFATAGPPALIVNYLDENPKDGNIDQVRVIYTHAVSIVADGGAGPDDPTASITGITLATTDYDNPGVSEIIYDLDGGALIPGTADPGLIVSYVQGQDLIITSIISGAEFPAGGAAQYNDEAEPVVLNVIPNPVTVTDTDAVPGGFTATIVFSETMNSAATSGDLVDFPTVGEDPSADFSLSSAVWQSADTELLLTLDVTDNNTNISNIDVDIVPLDLVVIDAVPDWPVDLQGNVMSVNSFADVFNVQTAAVPPTIVAAYFFDTDTDGAIDEMVVELNEDVDETSADINDFVPTGFSIDAISTAGGASANPLDVADGGGDAYVTFEVSGIPQTGIAGLSLAFTKDNDGNDFESAISGIAADDNASVSTVDLAAPVLIVVASGDGDRNGIIETVILAFSEAIEDVDNDDVAEDTEFGTLTMPDGTVFVAASSIGDANVTVDNVTNAPLGTVVLNLSAETVGVETGIGALDVTGANVFWEDANGNVAIEVVENLQDLAPPVFVSASAIDANNTFVDVTYSEGLYTTGGSGPVTLADFETFNLTGGVTSVVIDALFQTDGSTPLSGGESVIQFQITATNASTGNTFQIRPVDNAPFTAGDELNLFDGNANEATSPLTLNTADIVTFTALPSADNTYVVVIFSESVDDGNSALLYGSNDELYSEALVDNGGTVTAITINDQTMTDATGGAQSAGIEWRFDFSISGGGPLATGDETFLIGPPSNSGVLGTQANNVEILAADGSGTVPKGTTFAVNLADQTVNDFANATAIAYDDNNDGTIERITIDFDDNVDDSSVDAGDFTFNGISNDAFFSTTSSASDAGIANDDKITLLFTGYSGTAVSGNLFYIGSVEDDAALTSYNGASGNIFADGTAGLGITVSDAAAPVITSVETIDIKGHPQVNSPFTDRPNGRLDGLRVTFSEEIDLGTIANGDFSINAGGKTILGTTLTTNVLSIEFAEITSGFDGDDTPSVDVTVGDGVDDLFGNSLNPIGNPFIADDRIGPFAQIDSDLGAYAAPPSSIDYQDFSTPNAEGTLNLTISGTVENTASLVFVEVDGNGAVDIPAGGVWSVDVSVSDVGTYDVSVTTFDGSGNVGSDGSVDEIQITSSSTVDLISLWDADVCEDDDISLGTLTFQERATGNFSIQGDGNTGDFSNDPFFMMSLPTGFFFDTSIDPDAGIVVVNNTNADPVEILVDASYVGNAIVQLKFEVTGDDQLNDVSISGLMVTTTTESNLDGAPVDIVRFAGDADIFGANNNGLVVGSVRPYDTPEAPVDVDVVSIDPQYDVLGTAEFTSRVNISFTASVNPDSGPPVVARAITWADEIGNTLFVGSSPTNADLATLLDGTTPTGYFDFSNPGVYSFYITDETAQCVSDPLRFDVMLYDDDVLSLNHSGAAATFLQGETVTGLTSTATGTVRKTGTTIEVTNVVGTFINGEVIQGSVGFGAAVIISPPSIDRSFFTRTYNETDETDYIYISNPAGHSISLDPIPSAYLVDVDLASDPIKFGFSPSIATDAASPYTITYTITNDATGVSFGLSEDLSVVSGSNLLVVSPADQCSDSDGTPPILSLDVTNNVNSFSFNDEDFGPFPYIDYLVAETKGEGEAFFTGVYFMEGRDLHNGNAVGPITGVYQFDLDVADFNVPNGEYENVHFFSTIFDETGLYRIGGEDYMVIYGDPDASFNNIVADELFCTDQLEFTITQDIKYVLTLDDTDPANPVVSYVDQTNQPIAGYTIQISTDNGLTYTGTSWVVSDGQFNPQDPNNNGTVGDAEDFGFFRITYSTGNVGAGNCSTTITVDIEVQPQPNMLELSPETQADGGSNAFVNTDEYLLEFCQFSIADGYTLPGGGLNSVTGTIDTWSGSAIISNNYFYVLRGGSYIGYGYLEANAAPGTTNVNVTFNENLLYVDLQVGDVLYIYDYTLNNYTPTNLTAYTEDIIPAPVTWYDENQNQIAALDNLSFVKPADLGVNVSNGNYGADETVEFYFSTTSAEGCESELRKVTLEVYSQASSPDVDLTERDPDWPASVQSGSFYSLDFCVPLLTLSHDGLSTDFVNGEIVTGGVSGATGTVNTAGDKISLTFVTGTFQFGENISGNIGGNNANITSIEGGSTTPDSFHLDVGDPLTGSDVYKVQYHYIYDPTNGIFGDNLITLAVNSSAGFIVGETVQESNFSQTAVIYAIYNNNLLTRSSIGSPFSFQNGATVTGLTSGTNRTMTDDWDYGYVLNGNQLDLLTLYASDPGNFSEQYIDFTKVQNINGSSDFEGCQGQYSTLYVSGRTEEAAPSNTDFAYTGDFVSDLTFHAAEGTVMDEIFHSFPGGEDKYIWYGDNAKVDDITEFTSPTQSMNQNTLNGSGVADPNNRVELASGLLADKNDDAINDDYVYFVAKTDDVISSRGFDGCESLTQEVTVTVHAKQAAPSIVSDNSLATLGQPLSFPDINKDGNAGNDDANVDYYYAVCLDQVESTLLFNSNQGLFAYYSGLSGTFQEGELINGDGAGTPSAYITTDNAGELMLRDITGTFTPGETLTGASSAATATLDATHVYAGPSSRYEWYSHDGTNRQGLLYTGASPDFVVLQLSSIGSATNRYFEVVQVTDDDVFDGVEGESVLVRIEFFDQDDLTFTKITNGEDICYDDEGDALGDILLALTSDGVGATSADLTYSVSSYPIDFSDASINDNEGANGDGVGSPIIDLDAWHAAAGGLTVGGVTTTHTVTMTYVQVNGGCEITNSATIKIHPDPDITFAYDDNGDGTADADPDALELCFNSDNLNLLGISNQRLINYAQNSLSGGAFSGGQTITGLTSAASATIRYDNNATITYATLSGGVFGLSDIITGGTSGATGYLTFDNSSSRMNLDITGGTFQNGETISNGAGVSAIISLIGRSMVVFDVQGTFRTGETISNGGVTAVVGSLSTPTLSENSGIFASTQKSILYSSLAGGTFGLAQTITGGTSGATGRVGFDNGTDMMVLVNLSGTFQNGETISNVGGVSAIIDAQSTTSSAIGVTNNNQVTFDPEAANDNNPYQVRTRHALDFTYTDQFDCDYTITKVLYVNPIPETVPVAGGPENGQEIKFTQICEGSPLSAYVELVGIIDYSTYTFDWELPADASAILDYSGPRTPVGGVVSVTGDPSANGITFNSNTIDFVIGVTITNAAGCAIFLEELHDQQDLPELLFDNISDGDTFCANDPLDVDGMDVQIITSSDDSRIIDAITSDPTTDITDLTYVITSSPNDFADTNVVDDTGAPGDGIGNPFVDLDQWHDLANDGIDNDNLLGGDPTSHTITMTYTDNNYNQYQNEFSGCTVTESITILIYPDPDVSFVVTKNAINYDVQADAADFYGPVNTTVVASADHFCYDDNLVDLVGSFGPLTNAMVYSIGAGTGSFSSTTVGAVSITGNNTAKFDPTAAHDAAYPASLTPEHEPRSAHTIRFDYEDEFGCSNFIERDIYVNPLPDPAEVVAGPESGGQIKFSAICVESPITAFVELLDPVSGSIILNYSDYSFSWSLPFDLIPASDSYLNNSVTFSSSKVNTDGNKTFSIGVNVTNTLTGCSFDINEIHEQQSLPVLTFEGIADGDQYCAEDMVIPWGNMIDEWGITTTTRNGTDQFIGSTTFTDAADLQYTITSFRDDTPGTTVVRTGTGSLPDIDMADWHTGNATDGLTGATLVGGVHTVHVIDVTYTDNLDNDYQSDNSGVPIQTSCTNYATLTFTIYPDPDLSFTVDNIDISDADFGQPGGSISNDDFCYDYGLVDLQGVFGPLTAQFDVSAGDDPYEYDIAQGDGDFAIMISGTDTENPITGSAIVSAGNNAALFNPEVAHDLFWDDALGGQASYEFEPTSTHRIRFTYIDTYGCENYVEADVNVNPLPEPEDDPVEGFIQFDALCQGFAKTARVVILDDVTGLEVTDYSQYTFNWDLAPSSSSPSFVDNTVTFDDNNLIFTIGVTVTNNVTGCTISKSESETQGFAPEPSFTYVGITADDNDPTNLVDGLEVQLFQDNVSLTNNAPESITYLRFELTGGPTFVPPIERFDDGLTIADGGDGVPIDLSDILITGLAAGEYTANITMQTIKGCDITAPARTITILPIIDVGDPDLGQQYQEGFNGGTTGGWYIERASEDGKNDTTRVSSWELVGSPGVVYTPDASFINAANINMINNLGPAEGDGFFVTDYDSTYYADEISYVYSPAFNITLFENPALSFQHWRDFDSQRDGLAVQVSSDDGRNWIELGDNDLSSGVNWFTTQGVSAGPGESGRSPELATNEVAVGFADADRDEDGNGLVDWIESRHAINEGDPSTSLVRFRFALAAGGGEKFTKGQVGGLETITQVADGFAFDDFRIYEKNKRVIVEQFSSSLSLKSRNNEFYIQNGNFEDGTTGVPVTPLDHASVWDEGTVGLIINYYTDFYNNDVNNIVDRLNARNKVDPATRATYYGVSDAPATRIAGIEVPYDIEANPEDFGNGFDAISLESPDFLIPDADFTVDIGDTDELSGSVRFISQTDRTDDVELLFFVAVVEKRIPANSSGGMNGIDDPNSLFTADTDTAYHVLRKLLPGSAGWYYKGPLTAGQDVFGSLDFNFDWTISGIYNEDEMRVIAFVQYYNDAQKGNSLEQSNFIDLAGKTNVEVGILDELAKHGYDIYPNPSDEVLNLELKDIPNEDVYYKISDQAGREVLRGKVHRGAKSPEPINTSDLPSGLYIIQLNSEGRTFAPRKVLIKH